MAIVYEQVLYEAAAYSGSCRSAAWHPDHMWALDYQFDQTQDGRRLKLLNIVDEHTREALGIKVDRRIDADATPELTAR